MYITGGNDHLAHRLTQPHDRTIEFSQIFLRVRHSFFQHKAVIGNGLDFQVIVERSDPLQFIFSRTENHFLEQLIGLTGRTDYDAFPKP